MALKCVGVTLAMGALLFNICVTAQGTCTNPDTKVLILGGGMSGVAAAKKLYDSGWTDFIILEARDKVGGRMRTENFAGVKVEVGANWIHGVDDTQSEEFEKNPIWNLARLSGLQTVLDGETIVVYDGQNVATPFFDTVDKTLDTYYTKVEALSKPGGTGDKSMREALLSVGWNPQSPLQRFADWYKFDSDQATRPDNVSLYGWAEESTFTDFGESNYIVVDQRGYAYLVEYLGQSFLAKALHLNTTVSEIEYQENCVCANVRENGQQKKYCGNYGIVTFSIGVLQSKTVTFTPSLPQWKVSAINQVIIPLYLKVFVWFNETFWNTSVNFIGRVSEDPENYTLFVPIGYHIEGQPSVLLAILTGATAYRVAEQNVSVTKQELLTALRSVYGNFRAVINDILVPDWATNSLYYGAYGQPKVGYSSTTADTIADPINTLYFSGEATSQDYIGSVHGAYLAGVETASSIISAGRVNTLSFVAALLVLLNMAAM